MNESKSKVVNKQALSLKQFLFYFAAVGALLPALWLIFHWTIERNNQSVSQWLFQHSWTEDLLLILWPSSIFMIADPEAESVSIMSLSVAINILLYALVGWLFFIGLTRSRIVLGTTVILILVGWYELIHL